MVLQLEPVVAELSVVASQLFCRLVGVDGVLQVVEAVQLFLGLVGIVFPQRLIESSTRVYLIIYIAHLLQNVGGFAIVGHCLGGSLLRQQCHTHLVAGYCQFVTILRLAEVRYDASQHLLGFLVVMQADEYRGLLRQSHHTFRLVARFLVNLVGEVNMFQCLLVVTLCVVHLRCHALQHGHACRVVSFLSHLDALQHIFLGLIRLSGAHVDGGQRVQRRAHQVGIAAGLVLGVAQLSVLSCFLVVGQTYVCDSQQTQTVGLRIGVLAEGQRLLGIADSLGVLLLCVVPFSRPVPHLCTQGLRRCLIIELDILVNHLSGFQLDKETVGIFRCLVFVKCL